MFLKSENIIFNEIIYGLLTRIQKTNESIKNIKIDASTWFGGLVTVKLD